VKKTFVTLLVTAFLLSLAPAFSQGVPNGEVPSKLTLGMVPSRETQRIVDSLEPFTEMLSERLLIPVEAFVSTNFVGLVEAIGTGRVDIGMFGPASLVQAVDSYGAEVILATVRHGETSYKTQFTVQCDSGIDSFDDLAGKSIAFVDPASASGYQFPYVFLKNEYGIDANTDMSSIFAGSHDAAIIAVYNGDVDVAVSFNDAREGVQGDYPDVMEKLCVLGYTVDIPNDGTVVRKGLDENLVRNIQEAMIAIGETEEGSALLDEIFNGTGFGYVDPAVFDVVRDVSKEFQR
jgi:phosphonate transport system substrate-binding protein